MVSDAKCHRPPAANVRRSRGYRVLSSAPPSGLRVSPAAVSFQIKQIEDMSGFALFERVGRHVTLTAAGTALIVYARAILRALADADQALTSLRGVVGGRVTLGAVSTAKYIVPHVLARFQAQCPGVPSSCASATANR